jgi:hypothetical protein
VHHVMDVLVGWGRMVAGPEWAVVCVCVCVCLFQLLSVLVRMGPLLRRGPGT